MLYKLLAHFSYIISDKLRGHIVHIQILYGIKIFNRNYYKIPKNDTQYIVI